MIPQRTYPDTRLRRLKKTKWCRALTAENTITANDLILPVFIQEGNKNTPIPTMPGQERLCIHKLIQTAEKAAKLGINAIALFPVIKKEDKDEKGSKALNEKNILCQSIKQLKKEKLPIGIIADVALDPYTNHSHDGVIQKDGDVDNDKTIKILAQQALVQAQQGADIIAPSDMQDGRIQAIRKELDSKGFNHIPILAYTAKYASKFYSPFRDAIGATGLNNKNTTNIRKDKKSYQMHTANKNEALHAAYQNLNEGADILMVKPALAYLDIIQKIQEHTLSTVFAYQVSGEYTMLKLLAEKTQSCSTELFLESIIACKRAGAKAILSYNSIEIAKNLSKQY